MMNDRPKVKLGFTPSMTTCAGRTLVMDAAVQSQRAHARLRTAQENAVWLAQYHHQLATPRQPVSVTVAPPPPPRRTTDIEGGWEGAPVHGVDLQALYEQIDAQQELAA